MSSKAAKLAMAKGSSEVKPASKIEELKAHARNARDLSAEIKDLQERLTEKNKALYTLHTETMPDMMAQLGLDSIGVAPEGNLPGIDFELKKEITANIAASWDPARKERAYEVLKKHDAEGIIKTEVSAALPKGQLERAAKVIAAAKKLGVAMDLKRIVPHTTLGAWLREQYEDKPSPLSTSELDAIGAFVGFVVKPKERK